MEDHHSTRVFKVSDYVSSANITLAKISHLSKSSITGAGKYAPSTVALHT